MISLVLEVYGAIIVVNLVLAVIFSILSDIASTTLSEFDPRGTEWYNRFFGVKDIPEQNPERINFFKHIKEMF